MSALIALGALVPVVAPTALMSTLTANTMVMTHGSNVSNWWWNRVYRSRRLRYLFTDDDPDIYMLVLVILAMTMEENNYNTNCRKITLQPNTLFLISDPNFRYHGHFFDSKGKLIRNYIYFPLKEFKINSCMIQDSKGRNGYTKLLICPITDGLHIYGFEAWTYQWFWGAFGESSVSPSKASDAMRETLHQFKTYDGIEKKMRIIKMATGKIPPMNDSDKSLINDYVITYHKLIDSEYVPPKSDQTTSTEKTTKKAQT